jgi:hypothetical protein
MKENEMTRVNKNNLKLFAAAAVGLASLMNSHTTLAGDVQVAERFLKQVEEDLAPDGKGASQAELDMNNVQEQLEGVDAAQRKPLEARIAEAKKKIDVGLAGEKRDLLMRNLRRDIDNAKDNVTSEDAVEGAYKHVSEVLDGEDGKKLITGVDRKSLLAEVAGLRKTMRAAVAKRETERVEEILKKVDEQTPAILEKLKDNATRGGAETDAGWLLRELDRAEATLKEFPKDLPKTRELIDRHAKASARLLGPLKAEEREQIVGRSRQEWAEDVAKAAGWEKEQPNPSYGKFLSETVSGSSLGLEHTEQALRASNGWLTNEVTKAMIKAFPEDPEVLKMVAEAGAMKDGAAQKIAAAIHALVTEARKTAPTEAVRSKFDVLHTDLNPMLYGSSVRESAMAEVQTLLDEWEASRVAETKAKQELYNKLAAQADAAWGKTSPRYDSLPTIDPLKASEGQVIRLKGVYNRTGWEFPEGEYDFVAKVNGTPVAGKFDPAIRKAIEEAEKSTGRSVGDTLDFVATVEGKCRVEERFWSAILEDWRPKATWDAPLLKITALHSGAVTVYAAR